MRELLSTKGDVEYGTALIGSTQADPWSGERGPWSIWPSKSSGSDVRHNHQAGYAALPPGTGLSQRVGNARK